MRGRPPGRGATRPPARVGVLCLRDVRTRFRVPVSVTSDCFHCRHSPVQRVLTDRPGEADPVLSVRAEHSGLRRTMRFQS